MLKKYVLIAGLLGSGLSITALATNCHTHFSSTGGFFSGKTFSSWINQPSSPPSDAYQRLFHTLWLQHWQNEQGQPALYRISATNSQSRPGSPQVLTIAVAPDRMGSKVYIQFHVPPGTFTTRSLIEHEMCSLLRQAFSGPSAYSILHSQLKPASGTAPSPRSGPTPPTYAPSSYGVTHGPNAWKFDIAGVRLGMSYPQALSAITHFLHVPKSKFYFDFKPGIAPSVPSALWIKTKQGVYSVEFAHRTPGTPENPAVVESVQYSLVPWTAENRDALIKASIKRFGPPTTRSVGVQWCAKAKLGSCISAVPSLSCCSAMADPFVGDTTSASLLLAYPKYYRQWSSYQEEKQSTVPRF